MPFLATKKTVVEAGNGRKRSVQFRYVKLEAPIRCKSGHNCPAGINMQVSLLDGRRSTKKKACREEKSQRPISESHHYLEIREIKKHQMMKLSMRT